MKFRAKVLDSGLQVRGRVGARRACVSPCASTLSSSLPPPLTLCAQALHSHFLPALAKVDKETIIYLSSTKLR